MDSTKDAALAILATVALAEAACLQPPAPDEPDASSRGDARENTRSETDVDCDYRDKEEVLAEAEQVFHFGCDHDDDCSDDRFTCWDEGEEALGSAFADDESFVVRDAGHQTPGGHREDVWVVEEDGSGRLYSQSVGTDVAGDREPCYTDSASFDPIVRQLGGTIELRSGGPWKTLEEVREGLEDCRLVNAPPGRFDGTWIRAWGGPKTDFATAVAASERGIFVGGRIEPNESDSEDGSDGAVTRWDSAGEKAWQTPLATDTYDTVTDVAPATDGGMYAVGHTRGAIGDDTSSASEFDAFLARIGSSGETSWIQQLKAPDVQRAHGVALHPNGDVTMVGETRAPLDSSEDADELPAGFVATFTGSGELSETRLVSTRGDDVLRGVAVGSDGLVYVAGDTTGTFGDNTRSRESDAFVAAISPSTGLEWTRKFGSSESDRFMDVALGSDAVYAAGEVRGKLSAAEPPIEANDGVVAAIGLDGETNWLHGIGHSGRAGATGIATSSTGTIHATGRTTDKLGIETVSANKQNGFLVDVSATGERENTRLVATRSDDDALDIAVGPEGAVYVVGSTSSGWKSTEWLGGFSDGFLAKFD